MRADEAEKAASTFLKECRLLGYSIETHVCCRKRYGTQCTAFWVNAGNDDFVGLRCWEDGSCQVLAHSPQRGALEYPPGSFEEAMDTLYEWVREG